MERGRSIVRLFVQAPAANEDDHRLVAQVRRGDNSFSTRAFAALETDRWRKIRVVWKAASEPEAGDGVVRLRVGQEVVWEIKDLDNAAHRIDRIRFGQTSKGNKATAGRIYYDNFKARWSPSPVD
jgi:expansin (peptidoglycan-binding protein)